AVPENFGNGLRLREESQDVWGWTWLDHAWQDFRFALRTLLRSPGFALTACAILSIGIGVNLTLFQLVYAMFLRPLPVADVGSLVSFYYHTQTESSRGSSSLVPYPVTQFIQSSPALSAVLTE